VQTVNPFPVPPIPFPSSRTDATSLQGSPLEGTQRTFDVRTTQSADPTDAQVFNRTINNESSASILFAPDPINAAGLSFFGISRSFLIENTSNASVSFGISDFFAADLLAGVVGDAGVARTSLDYRLSFEKIAGPPPSIQTSFRFPKSSTKVRPGPQSATALPLMIADCFSRD